MKIKESFVGRFGLAAVSFGSTSYGVHTRAPQFRWL